MGNIGKIIGPPGTGKTTALMGLIDKAVNKYGGDRIGAVSYTNAAVQTIVDRIKARGGGKIPDNVRTIHSHAKRLMKIHKDQICDRDKANFSTFLQEYPKWDMKTADGATPDDDHFNYSEGLTSKANGQTFSKMQIYRNQMRPIDTWEPEVQSIFDDWKTFLQSHNYIDFTGLLEKCLTHERSPDIDVLFIDEAQDLTALQYRLSRQWADVAQSTIYAGDSDQSIYRWAGVAPEVFIDIDKTWLKVLDQSYRVPRSVLEYASNIIKQVARREDVTYKPNEENGNGLVYPCREPDLSLPGTHMIICRCNYGVRRYINWLLSNGQVWCNPYRPKDLSWNPTLTHPWKAYGIFSQLRKGKSVEGTQVQALVKAMKAKTCMEHGAKARIAKWQSHEYLDFYSIFDLPSLGFKTSFLDNKISPLDWMDSDAKIVPHIGQLYTNDAPRIIVGTIHSVKGGEADHVWVDTELTPNIYSDIQRNIGFAHDDEARLAYVAATRARKTLGIMMTRSRTRNIFFPAY